MDNVPLFHIQFLEEGAKIICKGVVSSGEILFVSPVDEWNTYNNNYALGSREELTG